MKPSPPLPEDARYDEIGYARELAYWHGLDLGVIDLTGDFRASIESLYHLDYPRPGRALPQTWSPTAALSQVILGGRAATRSLGYPAT